MRTVDLFGTVIVETEMAVLFDFGGDEDVWVPKACIHDGEKDGFSMVFTVGYQDSWNLAEWWAATNDVVRRM